jgi:hypothetical protein
MRYYRIYVRARVSPDYWMMLDVRAEDTLTKLDRFLRDTWLECCGHLSGFRIHGEHYESSPPDPRNPLDAWETPAESMRVRIENVLEPGDIAEYTYDYGSSTELTLRVVSERVGERRTKSVVVLARNEAPAWICETCGKKRAIAICPECAYDRLGMLCATCMKTHRCGEEMLLPIVNSPRMGVCGYTGEAGDEILWQLELDSGDESHDQDEPHDPDDSEAPTAIDNPAPSPQGKTIAFPDTGKAAQGVSRNPNLEDSLMDAMLSMFPEVSQEKVESLIDKLRNMSPEEKETFAKFGSRLFGNLWIALPETHDLLSLIKARSVANLRGMNAHLGVVSRQKDRHRLAEELANQYPSLHQTSLPYINPMLLSYWEDVLDAGGMQAMVDVKDEPKDQIQMLMSFGLLFPFRYQGNKVLVAPIEHLKQYPASKRRQLLRTCHTNAAKREDLVALLEFHGLLPLDEFLEEAGTIFGEPVTEEQLRLLFGEGIPSARLTHMGLLVILNDIPYMVRPDLENPAAFLAAQSKVTLPRRSASEYRMPAFVERMTKLDREITALIDMLQREIWDGDVDVDERIDGCLDALRQDVPDSVVMERLMAGSRKTTPFARKRAEQMFGKIADMVPRYSLKGYSRKEVEQR